MTNEQIYNELLRIFNEIKARGDVYLNQLDKAA